MRQAGDKTAGLQPFFIVGAPRCGTTALTYYLRGHPEVCFSRPKETHYFLSAAARQGPGAVRADFARRFLRDLGPRHRAFGEGSVSSLYAPEVPARMLEAFPEARFIAMVRHPVEMFRSYHGRLVFCRQETERDPNAAWAMQEARAAGRDVPRSCRDPRLLQYGEIIKLGRWIQQLFQTVGQERCHVVVFDDLRRDPNRVYQDVLEFIGLGFDNRELFQRKNVRRDFRSAWLQDLCFSKLFIPTIPLDSSDELDLSPLRLLTYPIHRAIRKFNSVIGDNPAELTNKTRASIRDCCSQDALLLGSLVDWTPFAIAAVKQREQNRRQRRRG